jgi:DNA-binding NarL/FixJ family response regulator
VTRGRLDEDAVEAVLAAAGQPTTKSARPQLTERKLEVLALLAQGKLTKQIASDLGIAHKTADNHIQNIYAKGLRRDRTGSAPSLSPLEGGSA